MSLLLSTQTFMCVLTPLCVHVCMWVHVHVCVHVGCLLQSVPSFFFSIKFSCVCVLEWGWACHSACAEVRGQPCGVSSPSTLWASGDRTQVIGLVLQMLYCWAILSHFYFLLCFVFETVSYWSWSLLMWLASARAPLFSASPVLRLQICTSVPNFFHMF